MARGMLSAYVGTVTRSDGSKQVTYRGHPLCTTSWWIRVLEPPRARGATISARDGIGRSVRRGDHRQRLIERVSDR